MQFENPRLFSDSGLEVLKSWSNTRVQGDSPIVPRSDQIRSDQIRSDQIRSDQIRSDQIRSDQIRSDQIRSDQIRSDQIRSDQIRSDQIRSDQIRSDQIRSDQIRSDQIRSDQIRSDQIRSDQIRSDQIRSDQIRSDQGVRDKAAEPMKSRFLNRELEIPLCFDKIWVSIWWRVTVPRKRPNVTVIHWQIRRQVKAETSEKWYRPLVSTTNEKWMRKDEGRCREGENGALRRLWCGTIVVRRRRVNSSTVWMVSWTIGRDAVSTDPNWNLD